MRHPVGFPSVCMRELKQTWLFRGSKSRNKVSVGEPAEGSLTRIHVSTPLCTPNRWERSSFCSHETQWCVWTSVPRFRVQVSDNLSPFSIIISTLLLKTPCTFCTEPFYFFPGLRWRRKRYYETKEQLLATDILVPATMKNAAKCDT